jgi:hypothetical protein
MQKAHGANDGAGPIDGARWAGYRAPVALDPRTRKPLLAGHEIDAWCTRCKLDLGHRIVALVANSPKRVVCMTCGSEHNYRAAKSAQTAAKAKAPKVLGARPAASSTASAKKPTSKAAAREEWEAAIRSGRPFRVYAASNRFNAGELVQHAKFGDGFVRDLVGTDKIIVAFGDGDRTLVHGLGA